MSNPSPKHKLLKEDIISSLGIPIIVIGKNFKSLSYNKKALQVFPEMHDWNSFMQILPAASSKALLKHCKKVTESGKDKLYLLSFAEKNWQVLISSGKKKEIILAFQSQPTEKKKEENDRYQQLLDSMGDSFVLTDENQIIVDVNKRFCEATGYSREKLIGFSSKIFDKGVSPALIKSRQRKAEKGSVTFDTKNVILKGQTVDAEVNMFLLKRNGRKYYGSIGRNITEYKKAQEEVKRTNERFKSITNSTQDALWELDTVTGERWANEAHQKLYGLTTNDPMPGSAKWEQRIHPSYRKQTIDSLDHAIESKRRQWNAEYWFKHFKGKWIFIYDRTLLEYNKAGNLVKMMGSMVDITQLKKTQDELAKQNILSEAIVNSLPGIFFLINHSNQFIRWNKNLETITGYDAQEIMKLQPHHFFSEKHSHLIYNKIKEAAEKGWAEMEVLIHTKSKVNLPFYLSVSHITIEKEDYLIGIASDISKVKEAQKKVRKMEAKIAEQKITEQKNISRAIIEAQEKERNFIGRELHDNVNQLLAGARLYLTMGAKNLEGFADVAHYPIELLDNGIHEIRALTHRSITPSKDISLEQLSLGIVDMLTAAGIHTTLNFGLHIEMKDNYRTNLYRILQEASANILKHSHAKNASISLLQKECSIHIRIVDDGKGFPLKQRKEGIGLQNISNRVDAYNGRLQIKSKPKQGCIIDIHLPITDCAEKGKKKPVSKKSGTKK